LSPRLLALKAGDPVFMADKFRGLFTLSAVPDELGVVLAATGTGVAPYMSMIRTEVRKGVRRRFAVIHGARHSNELGYQDELKSLSAASEFFEYFPVLSHAQEQRTPWNGHEGFVQDIWDSGVLQEAWGSEIKPDNTHAFLCGNPLMIKGMTEVLEKSGFRVHSKKTPGEIHTEQYFVKL
jgi:ferredoxin--NADP+ reductase